MKVNRNRLSTVLLFVITVCAVTLVVVLRPKTTKQESIRDYLKQEIESKYMSVVLYAEMACDASARGDLPDMEDSFNTGRQRQAESVGVLWLLQGIQYAEMGKYEKALPAAETALEHWPTHVESFAFKVHCLAVLQQTNQLSTLREWYQKNQDEMSNRERSLVNTAFGMTTGNSREEAEGSKDPFRDWLQSQTESAHQSSPDSSEQP